MKKILLLMFLITALISTSLASELPSINELMEKIQYNLDLTTDVRANVVLTQQKAEQGTKIIEMSYYRRDFDDSFFNCHVCARK